MERFELRTRDGVCPAYLFAPDGAGPSPGVLVFMDGLGIRPAMLEVGERLAGMGALALMPDLFYRSGPYEPMDPGATFADPARRKILFEKYFGPASIGNVMSDARACLDWLASDSRVAPGGVLTTGYCRGGFQSLTAAGTFPDEIHTAASFHGGQLATDAPDSPHRLIPRVKARVYVAGAIEDGSFSDAQKALLVETLAAAGVRHRVETYPGRHGFALRDTPVADAACAERHYRALAALLAGGFPS